jgi:NRAMP (natural resistance-associated macrophage protein)-like metal ion transporter
LIKRIKRVKSIGPGAFVAAAFIGPGTVTTCSIAGASFGYTLLWALLFSIIATLILQEMSARLGVIGQTGLGEAIREEFTKPLGKIIVAFLILSAIAIGNAAYETGNILGGVLGLETITGIGRVTIGGRTFGFWGPVIGLIAFILLNFGSYKTIEKGLIILVIVMSLTFISTAIIVRPNINEILSGLFIPVVPKGGILTVAGLIGTTVVPYNLFLHASAVREKWSDPSMLAASRIDSLIAIGAGGLISMAIIITSAAAFYGTAIEINGASDLAVQLQPLLGKSSGIFLSVGLLSAGLSSAITAPLAAAYATAGVLGWDRNLRSGKFKFVWISVLLTGVILSTLGIKPVKAIFFAQITNAILLPLIAIFLLKVMNSKDRLGKYSNGKIANIAGFIVVSVSILLGFKTIFSLFKII